VSFGKMSGYRPSQSVELIVENMSNRAQTYSFDIPYKQKGVSWKLPQSITLEKQERATIQIEMQVTSAVVDQGIHQGKLTMQSHDDTYHKQYLFMNETTDYPKAMSYEFSIEPFPYDAYQYQLYVTKPSKHQN